MSKPVKKVNDLSQLLLLITQTNEGLEQFVYDRLAVGDMWWIPDTVSGFGQRDSHPWVVVVPYKPNYPPVLACPRTTKQGRHKDELQTPAGLLPELDKPGSILLGHRRQFVAERFREFLYIGRLSDVWVQKINAGIRKQLGGNS